MPQAGKGQSCCSLGPCCAQGSLGALLCLLILLMLLIKQLECTELVSSFCFCSSVGLSVCSEGIAYNETANK